MAKERVYHDLKTVKEWLIKQPILCLPKTFELVDKNPQDFIKNFVLDYNNRFRTIYAKNGFRQCHVAGYRTAGDIFRITSFYFPKVKLITIYRVLFALIKEKKIGTNICEVVRKRVYFTRLYSAFQQAPTDELGIKFEDIDEFNGIRVKDEHDTSYLIQYNIK